MASSVVISDPSIAAPAPTAVKIDTTPVPPSWMPPWLDEKDVPLPSGSNSAVIMLDDQPLYSAPRGDSPRRGSAIGGARLPIFSARRGPGCAGRWINVGAMAWVCQEKIRFSSELPIAAGDTPRDEPDGLPFRYYFVGSNGSAAYTRLEFAELAAPDMELQPGFAVAIVEQRARGEDLYGRTHKGRWIPMRDLGPVRTQFFHGEEVVGGKLDFAWVLDDRTPVFSKPGGSSKATDLPFKMRFSVVQILEEKGSKGREMYRIDATHWVRAKDVRRPTKAAPPTEASGERWIDVELASQTLTAYEGDVPVFSTLVSTGKGAQGSATATPKGTFRIWVKLRTSTMDNLDDENAQSTYAIEDVPHVQFFSKGVGLHAAFWHSGFGRVKSHGCVNLAPIDAQRLFKFTGPRVPAGWWASLPTEHDRGTVVRVR
ncbi:MAG: L,D-transpeptidase [Polyangiaceae bacterium]